MHSNPYIELFTFRAHCQQNKRVCVYVVIS